MRAVEMHLMPDERAFPGIDAALRELPDIRRETLMNFDWHGDGTYTVLYRLTGSAIEPVRELFAEHEQVRSFDLVTEPDDRIYAFVHITEREGLSRLLDIADNHALLLERPFRFTDSGIRLTVAGEELAAVIDERCRAVDYDEVPEIVRGYTILNDVDALDQQGRTARKAFDGSAPLGPWLETDLDPRGIDMHTDVAGERRQEANTELMLFDPYEIVSYLSERFTFRPGDVIAFGSPENPGLVSPGDDVEITYEGVGTLRNTVVDSRNV